MKTKNRKNFFVLFLSLAIIFFSPITANASIISSTSINLPSSEISPCSEDIRWVYQKIGNQLYRRQFNYTRNVWIGNWEPC